MESGFLYSKIVDPFLLKMRQKVSQVVPPGKKVLDVACGTGAQVFELAGKSLFVTGVDYSDSMIEKAENTKSKKAITNTDFKLYDITQGLKFPDNYFDISIMSLALHQFSPELYHGILKEMKRVSSTLILVDYAVPVPQNLAGRGTEIAEYFAGKEHFRNYRYYKKTGGLPVIMKMNQIKLEKQQFFAWGVFQMAICS
jgi:SAM-dependent methyltransferase